MSLPQQRAAPSTSAPSQTSTTTPQTQTQNPTRILRLRGDGTSTGRSVQWAEDVVDNEGLGRKSSKGWSPLFRHRELVMADAGYSLLHLS
jgi:protein phosphatase 1 regulatory subunit 11